jgi:hypothetical protein
MRFKNVRPDLELRNFARPERARSPLISVSLDRKNGPRRDQQEEGLNYTFLPIILYPYFAAAALWRDPDDLLFDRLSSVGYNRRQFLD